MKHFKKIFALLAAMMMALAFVACSSDDDDPSVVAKLSIDVSGDESAFITFYDDGTFLAEDTEEGESYSYKGTYTGDVTKEGETISLDYGDGELVTYTVRDGKLVG
jgi:uncharacterized lipoprotein YehR (DUF1307 family)